jgi:hypothetical protein
LTTTFKKCCDLKNNTGSRLMNKHGDETLRTTIKGEIGIIAWTALARFFAAGTAVAVDAELNLADVAFEFSKNNTAAVQQWMSAGKVNGVSDEQAKMWFETDATVAAVVISPWVLVQEVIMATDQEDNLQV